MDTNEESYETRWGKLRSTFDSFVGRLDDAIDGCGIDDLDGLIPKLDVPTTLEQCITSAGTLRKNLDAMYKPQISFLEGTNKHLREISAFRKELEKATQHDIGLTDFTVRVFDHSSAQSDMIVRLLQELQEAYQQMDDIAIQTGLQEMMYDQDEQLKQQFFPNCTHYWGRHIVPNTPTLSPRVAFEVKDGPEDRYLPPEIMANIYAAADLETCVVLRQVSTKWYALFQLLDHMWSCKLRVRNPWMCPGDSDMKTWQDCMLAFVGRPRPGGLPNI
ncbi:hypothetical protein CJU89_5152 [Yarrowia sp. B02]|nr:hypothetical protein CJU89_5152 [Yarrowia sp. B02]